MTEKMTQSIGERLFRLRTQKGMTQEDMAEYFVSVCFLLRQSYLAIMSLHLIIKNMVLL